ncbi:molybdopterin-dependent oxidoreductase [Alterisphingorhabdus coralli]|uniref:Molybdopterin-dependent oxidoreductase n=1 Tax=Alterisphingorhabdus coralli TaxID=3071408 RepID=A0AA97F544_9SPHN|nr:molybdopterin-dependent oxidoreductase [Parasphingorhabdus sp. SCSIO 66989]WOE74504.1 molybdopterin-dependent oxidoreductase [Parasphingorhabdus sp. SCSIO 66989]
MTDTHKPSGLSLSKPVSQYGKTPFDRLRANGKGRQVSITRRKLLGGAALGLAGGLLSGCDMLNDSKPFRNMLRSAESANFTVQRALTDRQALATTFPESAISPVFPSNGTKEPDSASYARFAARDFAGWPLIIDGLVENPLDLTLEQVRAMPSQTQITRHDCVEGWSAIGKWTGVRLSHLLEQAKLKPEARYLVFHCADRLYGVPYYESIDLIDAHHPQTILAWALNDEPLPIGNGAPLRLRVERQLGYKHAKYVVRIEAVSTLGGVYGGKGGYWEDVANYAWYAGI